MAPASPVSAMDANASPVSPSVAAPVSSPAAAAEAVLDAEKMAVYRVALDLQELASGLVPAQQRVSHDQMERASLSTVLCVAEGCGRRSKRDKRRFYTMARGSATETAAIVDVLLRRRLAPEAACRSARSLALRVVQMLTKLDAALS